MNYDWKDFLIINVLFILLINKQTYSKCIKRMYKEIAQPLKQLIVHSLRV